MQSRVTRVGGFDGGQQGNGADEESYSTVKSPPCQSVGLLVADDCLREALAAVALAKPKHTDGEQGSLGHPL
jgi:hypothetical protein